jgi:hypothetical protein
MPRDGDSAVYELMELVQRERDPAAGRLYAEQRTKVRTAQKDSDGNTVLFRNGNFHSGVEVRELRAFHSCSESAVGFVSVDAMLSQYAR